MPGEIGRGSEEDVGKTAAAGAADAVLALTFEI